MRYYTLPCLAAVLFAIAASRATAADQDDRIEDAFKNTYVYRTQLKNADISIEADAGVVTLSGHVKDSDQKRLAEDTAEALPGVQQVNDELKVTAEPKPLSDDWIAMKVRGALLFHRHVSLTHTDVTVNDGVVTLTGTADDGAQKALAGEYAADVKGVKDVHNQIHIDARSDAEEGSVAKASDRHHHGQTLGEKIDDVSITAQLKFALAVRRSTSALHTKVTTDNGVVTVRGEARNSAEKDLVTQLAQDINGVRRVRNEMTVENS